MASEAQATEFRGGHLVPGADVRESLWLAGATGVWFLVLFVASHMRHAWFQSNLFDLGIFDQTLWLIAHDAPPIATTLGFHMLGDHASVILWPLALLYRIAPSVEWLFGVQALALALGSIPLRAMARERGIGLLWTRTLTLSYLLYPAIFNAALFDFHPEVIAVPALLWAARAGLQGRALPMLAWLALALACKEVLGLTVLFFGVWLFLEGRRSLGASAVLLGLGWFLLAAGWMIPAFSGRGPAGLVRYGYLGSSAREILLHAITNPWLVASHLLAPEAVAYTLSLVLPVVGLLRFDDWRPLVPALPAWSLNVLSVLPSQRDLVHQYALPILPFVFLWAMRSLERSRTGPPGRWSPRHQAFAAVLCFLSFARFGHFAGLYRSHLDHLPVLERAIALVTEEGAVLASSDLAAHLSGRRVVDMLDQRHGLPMPVGKYSYVLIDESHPAWRIDKGYARAIIAQLRRDGGWTSLFDEQGVVLFRNLRPDPATLR